MRIGAHVSASGGLVKAIANAQRLGCESLQMFVSNPRGWARPVADPATDERFRSLVAEAGLGPVFVHAPYLVNLASASEPNRRRSCSLLVATLERGVSVGAAGVVVHAGSDMGEGRERGLARTREAVLPLLERTSAPDLVLELTAGTRGDLAARFDQMAELLAALGDHPRVKVCFDTCHAHAAGYDLSGPETARATLDDLFAVLGDRVALVHANDCAEPRGARRDHHAPIGAGEIGLAGFAAILAHPGIAGLPVVIETPGTEEERAADVARLRTMSAATRTAEVAPRG